MPAKTPVVLENRFLRVQVDRRDLAAHVLVKATGETLRMAAAQSDDVCIVRRGKPEWRSFADSPITIRKPRPQALRARLGQAGLTIQIRLDGSDVVFEVGPAKGTRAGAAREVLYPRHFLLPAVKAAYATFPLGQGSIIPGDETALFHHREGYSETHANWLGGFTGKTGFCAIPETPDDLYLAVDHRADSPASVFFHWLGSLGQLRYTRRARYHFAKDLDYVRQAKVYRSWCQKVGFFRSLADKARENPSVEQLRGAPILCSQASVRREKTMTYEFTPFADLAKWVERFRKATGIKRAVVHIDGWGYWGYDAMHPDALPPNPDCGGPAGLAELARRVKDVGYLFGLHDQYIDFYAHAPSFDESLSIVTEAGRPVRVNRWCGGLCGHLCYHYIPAFLRRNFFEGVHKVYPMYHNSPSIWEICKPTAYYLDCFCRTVECFSDEHPMTRTQARQLMNECFKIVREGADGQGVVLSVEHPRDYSAAYLDFGWSVGHLTADVATTTGESQSRVVGIPVPLWHLAFHDAVCVPSPGKDLAEALLYAQAPYFWLRGKAIPEKELKQKKVLLDLHEQVGLAEMTGHEILSDDSSVQKTAFGGVEVEVDKKRGTYRITGAKGLGKGTRKL